jgi:hypothetical protein
VEGKEEGRKGEESYPARGKICKIIEGCCKQSPLLIFEYSLMCYSSRLQCCQLSEACDAYTVFATIRRTGGSGFLHMYFSDAILEDCPEVMATIYNALFNATSDGRAKQDANVAKLLRENDALKKADEENVARIKEMDAELVELRAKAALADEGP